MLLREGVPATAGDRGCNELRFVGFGIKVILAEDLRKPPLMERFSIGFT